MKTTKLFVALVLTLGAIPALADQKADAKAAITDIQSTLGFVPDFLRQVPQAALPGVWEEMKALELSSDSAIPPKYKELIGLAVAAQVPCKYCITAHTEFAKANGASKEELGAAVAGSALTTHWATYLSGTQVDVAKFRAEVTSMIEHHKKLGPAAPLDPTAPVDPSARAPVPADPSAPVDPSAAAPAAPIEVVDAQTALDDAKQQLGMVPQFLQTFPANALPGAWKTLRAVELNPDGPLPPKYANLINLAVSAQLACEYCVIWDTEYAKSNGATEEELHEAIAMGAFTRQMSTILNGLQINEGKFRSDVARMTRGKKVANR